MTKYLYAAYTVTWLIHLGYLAWLTRGYLRLRDDLEDLQRQ